MTSNLIAFWNLQEKEREAAEELRHNLESEKMTQAAHELEKLRINMDYNLRKWQLAEQERSNRASERIGEINARYAGQRVAIEQEYNRQMVALNERKRVNEAYYQQRKLQNEENYRKQELALKKRDIEQRERAQRWREVVDVGNFGLKLLEGGLALNG